MIPTLGLMLLGLGLLIALLIVFAVQQYRNNDGVRAAAIAPIPLESLRRRADNFRVAAGISLCGYGALKIVTHSLYVALNGIDRFSAVRGVFQPSPESDLVAFVGTLTLGTALLICGTLALRQKGLALWFAAGFIGFDLLISFAIGLAVFGDSRVKGGLFLILLSMALPVVVGVLVATALQNLLLTGQKLRMDAQAMSGRAE